MKYNLDVIREEKVYISDDYSIFRYKEENREIKVNAKLSASIEESGQIYPILIDNKFYVIDGQHRLEICKNLNIPVEFIIREVDVDTSLIIDINVSQKSWDTIDYIKSYASSGKESYKTILIKSNIYSFLNTTTIIEALKYASPTVAVKDIKSGEYLINSKDLKKAEFLFAYLQSKITENKIDKKLFSNTYFIRAVIILSKLDLFKWTRLSKILATAKKETIKDLKATSALKTLYMLYNKKLNSENQLVLKAVDLKKILK